MHFHSTHTWYLSVYSNMVNIDLTLLIHCMIRSQVRTVLQAEQVMTQLHTLVCKTHHSCTRPVAKLTHLTILTQLLLQSLLLPIISPLTSPMTGPLTSPMTGLLTSPMTGPLTSPKDGPLTSFMIGPFASLMTGPLTSPVAGPRTSPMMGAKIGTQAILRIMQGRAATSRPSKRRSGIAKPLQKGQAMTPRTQGRTAPSSPMQGRPPAEGHQTGSQPLMLVAVNLSHRCQAKISLMLKTNGIARGILGKSARNRTSPTLQRLVTTSSKLTGVAALNSPSPGHQASRSHTQPQQAMMIPS